MHPDRFSGKSACSLPGQHFSIFRSGLPSWILAATSQTASGAGGGKLKDIHLNASMVVFRKSKIGLPVPATLVAFEADLFLEGSVIAADIKPPNSYRS
jgi:hypothetical protein